MKRGAILSAVLMALGACSEEQATPPPPPAASEQMLDCAIGPGTGFSESCTLQKFERENETIYRVNHPGGGFRMFTVAADGSGMVPYDGADGAVNRLEGEMLEVTVGDERYRFPIKTPKPAPTKTDAQ